MRNIQNEIAGWKKRLEAPDRTWDPKVILDARQGNQNAVKLFVRRFERRLAKIIDARLREIQISDKEDIMQETLAQIYRRIGDEGFCWKNEASFFQFAVLIVTEAIAKHLEAETWRTGAANPLEQAGRSNPEFFYEDPTDWGAVEDLRQKRMLLDEAMETRLDPANREIMQLWGQGESLKKISEKLNIPLNVLRVQIGRSLKELRRYLDSLRYWKE